MKKILLLIASFLPLAASAIDANVTYAIFQTSDAKSYIEVYVYIAKSSVKFAPTANQAPLYQANLGFTIQVLEGDKTIASETYNVNTTPVANVNSIGDLVEQHTFLLPADMAYGLKVNIIDHNMSGNYYEYSDIVKVVTTLDKPQLSSLEILSDIQPDSTESKFSKNGYRLMPIGLHFLGKSETALRFYVEMYRTNLLPDKLYLLRYRITQAEAPYDNVLNLGGMKRLEKSSYDFFAASLNVAKLPSGTYNFVVELLNAKGELIDVKLIPFVRSNPVGEQPLVLAPKVEDVNDPNAKFTDNLSVEQLDFAILATMPQLNGGLADQAGNALKSNVVDEKKQFLYVYWVQAAPENTANTFREFMRAALAIDEKYRGGGRRGVQTARGRVMLRYGTPDDIYIMDADQQKIPYEMWTYHNLNKLQSEAQFVFYNPSLLPNGYQLLHSTARGELSNPNWRDEIARRRSGSAPNGGSQTIDGTPKGYSNDDWRD